MNYASMERQRLWVVLATIVINVVAVSSLTLAPWSDWRAALALNAVDECLLVGFVFVRRDALLARFIVFGLAAGLIELAADACLVVRNSLSRAGIRTVDPTVVREEGVKR